jgi:hypothetical protein
MCDLRPASTHVMWCGAVRCATPFSLPDMSVRIRDQLGPGFIEIHHQIGQTMTGLGYHGHIALVVYVKEWLVQEGICECSRAVKYVVVQSPSSACWCLRAKGGGGWSPMLPWLSFFCVFPVVNPLLSDGC